MKWNVRIVPCSRRDFMRVAGLGALAISLPKSIANAQDVQREYGIPKANYDKKQVWAQWRYVGTVYYFDPIGLYVQPGDTVDFFIVGGSGRAPTITAYHPDNDNHELRIPENAKSFDTGVTRNNPREPGLRQTFEVEGTYDYFSKFEETKGMIGRVVVGKPGGPGEKPWGYGNKEGRRPIPAEVLMRAKLLNSQEIVKKVVVPFPWKDFTTPYPLW